MRVKRKAREEEEVGWGEGERAIMVLFVKQVHLQKEVGAVVCGVLAMVVFEGRYGGLGGRLASRATEREMEGGVTYRMRK